MPAIQWLLAIVADSNHPALHMVDNEILKIKVNGQSSKTRNGKKKTCIGLQSLHNIVCDLLGGNAAANNNLVPLLHRMDNEHTRTVNDDVNTILAFMEETELRQRQKCYSKFIKGHETRVKNVVGRLQNLLMDNIGLSFADTEGGAAADLVDKPAVVKSRKSKKRKKSQKKQQQKKGGAAKKRQKTAPSSREKRKQTNQEIFGDDDEEEDEEDAKGSADGGNALPPRDAQC